MKSLLLHFYKAVLICCIVLLSTFIDPCIKYYALLFAVKAKIIFKLEQTEFIML